jgi:hypothetical protein
MFDLAIKFVPFFLVVLDVLQRATSGRRLPLLCLSGLTVQRYKKYFIYANIFKKFFAQNVKNQFS